MSPDFAGVILDALKEDPRFERLIIQSLVQSWESLDLGHELNALMENISQELDQQEREDMRGRYNFDDDKALFPNNIDNHLGEI